MRIRPYIVLHCLIKDKSSEKSWLEVLIPSCIQVDTKQTSEVFKTSEVSPKIDVILIAKAN
jgi:hypothetical protein